VGGQHTAARKTAALGAGAVGGVALFAVALPQLASTFNPTKLGTALLTVAAALVTAAGDRWIQLYKQRKALETAVRAWPPERLRAHDPATLGVYPPRDRDGNPQPYQPRAEDAELDQALGAAQIVVVDGPAGGGKSRAAAEAARRKLPVVPAIVPVSDLRDAAADVLDRVRKSREPVVITQRGRAAAVMVSIRWTGIVSAARPAA